MPSKDVAEGGAENRGPGQTGELLVGAGGSRPTIGEDDAGAIVAFWDSPAHASGSPNAKDADPAVHAEAFGSVTIQPFKLAPQSRDIGRIEDCVR